MEIGPLVVNLDPLWVGEYLVIDALIDAVHVLFKVPAEKKHKHIY